MRPILYTLTSSLHGEMAPDPRQEPFIRELEAALGAAFDCRGADFSSYHSAAPDAPEIIYVRTGGTEGLFLEHVAPLLPGAGTTVRPVLLLASGQSNSLAASMEILSWLQQRGIPGEILHGTPATIASQLSSSPARHGETMTEALTPETFGRILEGKRFGVIGRPSDWLISSNVDYAAARENLGPELIDIPIEELVAEVRNEAGACDSSAPKMGNFGADPAFETGVGAEKGQNRCQPTELKPLNKPKYGRKIDADDWGGALAIYDALKTLAGRYRLDGLTLRCFDLLTALHNTGCLALARLNAEGITATCEGDVPAMLSMAVARALTGRSSFQVNLSRIEGDRLLFAHCTVPLDIVEDYCYDTHFESGIGVALHGRVPEGPVTLFKISPDFRRMFRREAKLVANPYEDNLCRTQVVVEAPGAAAYFLQEPIGNHHIIVPGIL